MKQDGVSGFMGKHQCFFLLQLELVPNIPSLKSHDPAKEHQGHFPFGLGQIGDQGYRDEIAQHQLYTIERDILDDKTFLPGHPSYNGIHHPDGPVEPIDQKSGKQIGQCQCNDQNPEAQDQSQKRNDEQIGDKKKCGKLVKMEQTDGQYAQLGRNAHRK